MISKLLTAEEVAELLNVKVSTIYQRTHTGFVPHVKLGRFVRFKETNIEKWLQKRTCHGMTSQKISIDLA